MATTGTALRKQQPMAKRLTGRAPGAPRSETASRHKRHAPRLYEQIHQALCVPGLVLICDHSPFDDSPKGLALYMTEQEQQHALANARFGNVHVELAAHGLLLYAGERTA